MVFFEMASDRAPAVAFENMFTENPGGTLRLFSTSWLKLCPAVKQTATDNSSNLSMTRRCDTTRACRRISARICIGVGKGKSLLG